jgi:hypothetical protein
MRTLSPLRGTPMAVPTFAKRYDAGLYVRVQECIMGLQRDCRKDIAAVPSPIVAWLRSDMVQHRVESCVSCSCSGRAGHPCGRGEGVQIVEA